MKTLKSIILISLVMFATSDLLAQKKVNPTGTWTFHAEEAPYEYNTGDIIVDKDGKEYTAKIVFGGDYELKGSSVTYEKNELSFTFYIEGESIHIKTTVGKDSMEGIASYSGGDIAITARKKS